MHRTKTFLAVLALLVCAAVITVALAESELTGLWKSGCDFLFHTDNVTVQGEAVLSLNGERFKTVKLNYIQDGYNSFYGLTLLTPKDDGTERETGWTIIADAEGFVNVMEAYDPGYYRPGHSDPQNTLLRRTVRLDALTDLGGLLAAQIEPMFPQGTITVSEQDGGKAIHIAIKEDQIPDLAVSALNLAAGYLSERWFSYSYDRTVNEKEGPAFDSYVTVTQALTDGTTRWALRDLDAVFTTDAEGRLTGAKGTLRVVSTFWDGVEREVEAAFDFTASDYGTSHVKPFDPDDYHVTLSPDCYEMGAEVPELDEKEWEKWMDKALELTRAQGYTVSDGVSIGGWQSGPFIQINIEDNQENAFFCAYQTEDGSLVTFQNMTDPWFIADEGDMSAVAPGTLDAAKELISSFAKAQHITLSETQENVWKCLAMANGTQYLFFADGATNCFAVQTAPTLRLVYYSAEWVPDELGDV